MASQLKSQEAAFKNHRKPKKARKEKKDDKVRPKVTTHARSAVNAKRNERRKKARLVAKRMRLETKQGAAVESGGPVKAEEEKEEEEDEDDETSPDTEMEEAE